MQAKRNPLFPQLPARDEGFATMIKIDHFNPFASFAGWGKGGVEGLWSGDGDLHLDPDRPLPSRRRLSCQETDQPGGT